jgi:hypothetical protein
MWTDELKRKDWCGRCEESAGMFDAIAECLNTDCIQPQSPICLALRDYAIAIESPYLAGAE